MLNQRTKQMFLKKKIKELSPDELKKYRNNKKKEWRLKNPEKDKAERKRYKKSPRGIAANKRYFEKNKNRLNDSRNESRNEKYNTNEQYRNKKLEEGRKYRETGKLNDYMRKYLKDREKHKKYLLRQKDNHNKHTLLLKEKSFCSLCGNSNKLEIHHTTYENPGNIIFLCRTCHRYVHRKNFKMQGGQK